MFKTRLSACPTFRDLSITDKTTMLQRSKGCTLCLDRTDTHTRDKWLSKVRGELYGNCKVLVNGV